jgi:hypothetical protein
MDTLGNFSLMLFVLNSSPERSGLVQEELNFNSTKFTNQERLLAA